MPLHPEVKSDKPGKCPKCGMDLVPDEEHEQHKQMVIQEHEKMIWTHFTIVLLGLFLLVSPYTFGYKSSAMMYSDNISGILLIVFGFLSPNPFRDYGRRGLPALQVCGFLQLHSFFGRPMQPLI